MGLLHGSALPENTSPWQQNAALPWKPGNNQFSHSFLAAATERPLRFRMDFVKNFVLTSFKLNEDKWKKCLSAEDKKKVLEEFLDSEENLMLCVSVNAAGDLAPSPEYSCGSDRKVLYFKKKKMKLTGENIRRSVRVGNLSPALQDQVSNLHQVNCF